MKKLLSLLLALTLVLSAVGFSSCSFFNPRKPSGGTGETGKIKRLELPDYSVSRVGGFHYGYSWVNARRERDKKTFHALVDPNGDVMFTDIDGLTDDNGNIFYPKYDLEYEYYKDSWKEPYYYHDDSVMLSCTSTDSEDKEYLCIIDKYGHVHDSFEYYSPQYVSYCGDNAYILGQHNNDSSAMAVAMDKGIIADNIRYFTPLGYGYAQIYAVETGFDTFDEESIIIDSSGNSIDDEEAFKYDCFVSDKMMFSEEKSYSVHTSYFYNIETKKAFVIEDNVNGSVLDKGSIDNIIKNYDGDDYLIYMDVAPEGDQDENAYVSFLRIDTNGEAETIYSFKKTDKKDDYDGYRSYELLQYHEGSGNCLIYYRGKYYCLNLDSGACSELFSDYSHLVDKAAMGGNTFVAKINGKDSKGYYSVCDSEGKDIIAPTLYSDSISKAVQLQVISGNSGAVYLSVLGMVFSDGNILEGYKLRVDEEPLYSDGWLITYDQPNGYYSVADYCNYINSKNEFLFD